MQVKLIKFKKNPNLSEARELVKLFCKDFKIKEARLYYVDKMTKKKGDVLGEYYPSLILIEDSYKNLNKLGIIIHELTHHLEYVKYNTDLFMHGNGYQQSKKRVIKWCKETISPFSDWRHPLRAKIDTDEMKSFKLYK